MMRVVAVPDGAVQQRWVEGGPGVGSAVREGADTMPLLRLSKAVFLLAACALAVSAHADYGQMRLDGVGLFLALLLSIAYGLVVDVALIARLFRYRAILVVGLVLAAIVIALLLLAVASPAERTGFFKGAPGGAPLVILLVTSAVFLPFIVIAPLAQHRAIHEGQRWPHWITAWMVLQVALVPGFMLLASADQKFWERDYAAGFALGRETVAGGFGAIRERADGQRERIWGTGWTMPWKPAVPPGSRERMSGWMAGLARGVDASAPIAADSPLSEPDRTVLQTLLDGHFAGYATPNIRTKLIWDALEPGAFARQLAPNGLHEEGVIGDVDEVIPRLLVRLEQDTSGRLCPGGQMIDADRAILREFVLEKVKIYGEARAREARSEEEAKKLEAEMAEAPAPYRILWQAAKAVGDRYGGRSVQPPDWDSFPERVEQLCRAPQ